MSLPPPKGLALLGVGVVLTLAVVTGLVRSPAAAPSAGGETLTVFAAASLSGPFEMIGRLFEERHPGTRVLFHFAGSQQLAAQIEQGARADLLASADERWIRYLGDRNLVSHPRVFAENTLVAVVPASNPGGVRSLGDLARPGLRLVLAAEPVPAGRYARQALAALSRSQELGASFGERVLANVVSEEENVRLVLAKVELGEADAGIVYRTDVSPAAAARLRVLSIPESYNVRARYPVAVVNESPRPALAADFVELLLSPAGQRVLEDFGFLPATGEASRG